MSSFITLQLIVSQTPAFVWGILVFCISIGVMQSRDQRMKRQRLLLVPVIWMLFGLWGVTSVFGLQAQSLAFWSLGLALTAAALKRFNWSVGSRLDASSGQYFVPGSWLPMAMIMSIFLVKYCVGISLVIAPQVIQDTRFLVGISALYGALSGLFIARALSILQRSKQGHGENGQAFAA